MQWYWDAFDNEIHRSLVDIVSSTQLSINEAERAPLPASSANGHSAGRSSGTPDRNSIERNPSVLGRNTTERTPSAPGGNSADDWKALLERGLEAQSLSAVPATGLDASAYGHSVERNFGGPGRNSADDWKALLNRGLAARTLGAAPPRGLDAANGARLGRSEEHENGTDSLNGTSNGNRNLLSKMPSAGSTVGLQGRTAGKDSALGELTFGTVWSARKNGPRQLPPLGSDVSRVASNGVNERASNSVTGSLGRWDYLKRDGFLDGLRVSGNGVLGESITMRSKQAAGKEPIESRSTEIGKRSVPGDRYGSRGHAWRSLDLGQGPANEILEEERPRTSSGSGERDDKSSY